MAFFEHDKKGNAKCKTSVLYIFVWKLFLVVTTSHWSNGIPKNPLYISVCEGEVVAAYFSGRN